MSTRHAYRDHLIGLMARDERVVCLDTDTGLFQGADFGPAADRYLNLGIAEHNLMGVAAGLAASGWIPYANTMAAFASTRAAEAVKIDIAYNGLPVRIVATHSGVSAGHLGPTHHSLEDLAVMRTFPNMTVVVPADADGTVALLDQVHPLPGPVYLRLGRKPTPPLPEGTEGPRLGGPQQMRAGRDTVIVCTGPHAVLGALAAADDLAAEGVEAAVVQVHTVKPLHAAALTAMVVGDGPVVTVEEHWRTGGVGSAVAEVLAETAPRRVLRVGLPDAFVSTVGTQEELLAAAGVSRYGIADAVRGALGRAHRPAHITRREE